MKGLQIGSDFILPLDAVTQTFGILGKRGVGKTSAAVVMAEEMLEHQLQVVALDPVGVWWGLRSNVSGKSAGYPIPVFGGDHGDLPLEAAAGPMLADFLVDKRASAVLDLSLFSKTDQTRFAGEFLERLYRKNRLPLHVVIDEADAFAPQRLHPSMTRCFGAVDQVVRRGRARGLGVTLVTQRSAAINKDVLSQIEVLVAFRTLSPHDRAALEAWVDQHGDDQTWKAMLQSLAELKIGEAWWWSPAWLGVFKRVKVRKRNTFDSSATPVVGAGARAAVKVAPVDLEALGAEFKQLAAKAEAEDPRRLQAALQKERGENHARYRMIQELQAKLDARPAAAPAKPPKRVEVPVFAKSHEQQLARLVKAAGAMLEGVRRLEARVDQVRGALVPVPEKPTPLLVKWNEPARQSNAEVERTVMMKARQVGTTASTQRQITDAVLGAGERAVLTAIAQHAGGVSRDQLSILTGYKRSTRDAYVQRLQKAALVDVDGGRVTVTDAGLQVLGPAFQPLPTGDALRVHWLGRLPEGERKILEVLIDSHPNTVPREQLSEATGYQRSTRDAYVQRLTARRLVEASGRGEVRARDELFG